MVRAGDCESNKMLILGLFLGVGVGVFVFVLPGLGKEDNFYWSSQSMLTHTRNIH